MFEMTWPSRPRGRSVGWDLTSSGTCFYCEEAIEDFRSVKFQMPSSSIWLHEGECWDLFVVGVALFNNLLVDFEATPN